MTEQEKPAKPLPREFVLRVNDFIEMANRVERRFDASHAHFSMLHAFARYSGHHYRSTTALDTLQSREEYADSLCSVLKDSILGHLADMAGATPAAPSAVEAPAE